MLSAMTAYKARWPAKRTSSMNVLKYNTAKPEALMLATQADGIGDFLQLLFRRGETYAPAIVRLVLSEIAKQPLAAVEYVKICDAQTLDELEEINRPAVLALAVRIGRARLIDNKTLLQQKAGRCG